MIGIPSRTTLFCDFDGPIVDVSERYYATYCLALEQMMTDIGPSNHCKLLTKEQFWYLKQQRVPDFEIALRSGIPDDKVEFFLDTVRGLVNHASLLQKDQLQPGIRWALELLHSQSIRLILVTLRRQAQVQSLLRAYGLDHLFKRVWGTQDDDAAYRNSVESKCALLAHAWADDCKRHGMPKHAWMVGDTEADILAGQSSNIATVALTCGIRSRSYLAQYQPTYICNDLVAITHSLMNGVSVSSLSGS
ncbi:MAG: HAD family hydrolase [Leptolyngbyaceae cyanobacterium]